MTDEAAAPEVGFADLFEQSCKGSLWANKVVKGTITAVDDNFVTVDVGLKSEGRIPMSEFCCGGAKPELKVGDVVDVLVDRYESKNGEIVLSREKALREAAWDDFEECFRKRKPIMGTIFNRVKGGFMVALKGTTAFLPGSQADVRPIKDITPLLGVEQPFMILKMDKLRENIVVSRREILEGANAEEISKVLDSLEEGKIIDGVVKNITSYGVFVDIGGVDGLLHNTDISWKRVNHPSEVLSPGQPVKVKVIKFNRETRRISLGIKQLSADPWEGVDTVFKVGDRVTGKVTNITDYGLFVELKEGVEGLVYMSEVSWKKNVSPHSIAKQGDDIEVIVLDVDTVKRRIGLGIKQLQENPWAKVVKEFPVGHVFDTVITNVTEFGVFAQIADDIDGMIHRNDLAWERISDEALAQFKKGDTITVKVLEINPEKERIALGVKQLTEPSAAIRDLEIKKGAVVTCVIASLEEDGIEVTLADGTPGFIKKADLAKDRQDRRTDRFAVGEKVDAKITSIDKNRKVYLSIRVLEIEKEKQAMAEFGSSNSGASLGDILGVAIAKSKKD